jgi:hypothetical protein
VNVKTHTTEGVKVQLTEQQIDALGTEFVLARGGRHLDPMSDAGAKLIADTLIYEARLREGQAAPSTTREQLNLTAALAALGVPMRQQFAAPPEVDLTPSEIMRAYAEEGVPLRGRDGLRLEPLRSSAPRATPEDDAPSPVASAASTRLGTDAGKRIDCPRCENGLRKNGERCETCAGLGYTLERTREANARAVERLAVGAIENASAATGIPFKVDGDLGSTLTTAQKFTEAVTPVPEGERTVQETTAFYAAEGVPTTEALR